MFIAKSQVLHVAIEMHCNALWPFLREKMDTSFTNMRLLNYKYLCQKRAAMHHLTMKTRWNWGLGLRLGGLERSQWWAPRATSAQVPLVQVQVPKSNSASPRWTWGLGLGLGGLERSRPSPPPPAVGLIPKYTNT